MKTYLMALLAAAMMLFGASAFASEADAEVSSHSSSSASLDVEELTPVAEDAKDAAEAPAPAMKPVKHYNRSKSNKPRAKDLDFRHCLELEDNAAIAQCAQE